MTDHYRTELVEKDATITALRAEVERLRRKHHSMCYQNCGVPDDLPADLCDCKGLWMLEGGQAVTQRAESAEAEIRALNVNKARLAQVQVLAASEPMIVSGIRLDMAASPDGRGGELHHIPATVGHGKEGCPGDNLTEWFDQLREMLDHG